MNVFYQIVISLVLFSFSSISFATDTRSYNMVPIGTNIIDSQYLHIETLQTAATGIEGKQTQKQIFLRDTYFFNVADKLGAAYIMIPYSQQTLDISKPFKLSKDNEGFGDVRVLFALGLYNAPALNREEFIKYDKNGTHAACSVSVTLPTGSYNKLFSANSGGNRYIYKPECAVYWVHQQFQSEFFLGNSIYTDNTSYSGNKNLSQSNLYNIEARFSYNFTPAFWASTDFIYYKGGETSINGVKQKDEQSNLNAGFTLSYRIAPSQGVKFIYQKTVSSKELSPTMKNGFSLGYYLAF